MVQSSAVKPYQTAFSSFQTALSLFPAQGGKTILPVKYHKIILTDMGQEALFLFSLEKKIPVMTFAPRYLKDGAVLVVGFDVRAMGREVAGLVRKFLNGTPVSELAPVKTRQIKTKINEKIAAKFGLKINHGDKP